MVCFDLDGTLLSDNKQVNTKDLETLKILGAKNILRIVATGRNLYSLKKVLPRNFPIDYAVFSSGAGIYNWKTQQIIKTWLMDKACIRQALQIIEAKKLNFTLHLPIPNNHHIFLNSSYLGANDLQNYVKHYQEFAQPFHPDKIPNKATQLVVLLNHKHKLFTYFKNQLPHLKIIRTTSPIDNQSNWIEIFNKNVSKANGIRYIATLLQIKNPKVFTIGNDYNDTDLLNFGHVSYVVNNAPDELKKKYKITGSNNENALSQALSNHLSFVFY